MTGINAGTKVPCSCAFQFSLVCFLCISLGHLEVLGYVSQQLQSPRSSLAGSSESSSTTPYFDDVSRRDIEAIEGQTVIIPCTVRNLSQEKVVSWIRTRDIHILTSGPHVFSGDYRFEAVHTDTNEDFWGLRIRGVKADDTGQYECQVNTEPKMSLAYKLTVASPASNDDDSKWLGYAKINGPKEVFVQLSTPYYVSCEIFPSFTRHVKNLDVWWLHEDTQILFQLKESRISIQTSYNKDKNLVQSILSLHYVTWQDGGTYTCLQPSVKKDYMKLVVVEAESSEAMQRDLPASSRSPRIFAFILHIIIYLFLSTNSYFLLFF